MKNLISFKNICATRTKYSFSPSYYMCVFRTFSSTTKEGAPKEPEPIDVLQDLREPELSETDILRKRFRSRLNERVYKKFVAKEPLPLETKFDFQMKNLQKHYGMFGKASNLNPGLCWPTREEVLEIMHYDKIFEPPLEERLKSVAAKKQAEDSAKKEYEDEVDVNMSKLDKWIADFHAKNAQKDAKANELRLKREQLVEEISEYLGYDIDPKDPRFKEAVEQKEKEKKKAAKAKKQQESYDRMLEKLKKIAQNK